MSVTYRKQLPKIYHIYKNYFMSLCLFVRYIFGQFLTGSGKLMDGMHNPQIEQVAESIFGISMVKIHIKCETITIKFRE